MWGCASCLIVQVLADYWLLCNYYQFVVDYWVIVTKLDKIRNERIRRVHLLATKVGEIEKKVHERSLKYYGHVMRRQEHYVGRRVMGMKVQGRRKRGRPKGPCKYKKYIKIQKKFGYDTPHPPTPLSKKKKFRKISKVINHEYLYIEARTKA